ncbi:mitochondrial carrier [Tilletiaria anomala UBC 951]|uniref:Mitochondrial carrier n=1 Tax=Tilletiaria anomala (strain ATCC 24038 / CBS 436.72 / UBC 951) TaxID=1037660 RepID=A0A066VSX8_TILAU|nr:mitochondrial carrier [Tilletiaria anomala UBC 951]KDN41690.1 mitochondrial carrier [Tilletiaria anomala UBC 951]
MVAKPGMGPSSGLTAQVPQFNAADYSRFLVAGGLCATLTHGAMTPIDVIKTRLQLEPKGSKFTMFSMGRHIVASEGPAGLLTGFGPTAVGYLVQGGLKFSGFEYFKRAGVQAVGGYENAVAYRTQIHILAAAAAEVIATTALTPLEAARIRLVSEHAYAKGLVGAITRMSREQGIKGFYAGYIPILFKQVPYAIGQFATNEAMHEFVRKTPSLASLGKKGKAGEVTVQLGCGLVAGAAAAVLSHPADTLLSKINKGGGGAGGMLKKLTLLAKDAGPVGIWAGLGTRTVMTCFLVAGQFLIYAQIKQAVGAPPGVEIQKAE